MTVMKDGNQVFRVHKPGTHGHSDASITKFRLGKVNPKTGRPFANPEQKVSILDENAFGVLQQAARGDGGYSL